MTERIRLGVPIIVLALLVLLAASISHVSFVGTRYGPPSEPSEESSSTLRASPQDGQGLAPLIGQIIAVTAIALVLFGVVVSLLRPKSLWEALKRALPAALWFAAILLILLRWRDRPFFGDSEDAPAGGGTVPAEPDQPFPTLEQVHVPSWATFLFVLGALFVVGVMIFIVWRLWRARARTTPIEELAELTQRYAQELRYGAPVHETILRCYREMCQLLSERFHLEISRAMTAREFERRLAQIGVLEEHIVRMSRLFEWARYSPARPTPEQEREALQLLEEITQIYGRREVFQTA